MIFFLLLMCCPLLARVSISIYHFAIELDPAVISRHTIDSSVTYILVESKARERERKDEKGEKGVFNSCICSAMSGTNKAQTSTRTLNSNT